MVKIKGIKVGKYYDEQTMKNVQCFIYGTDTLKYLAEIDGVLKEFETAQEAVWKLSVYHLYDYFKPNTNGKKLLNLYIDNLRYLEDIKSGKGVTCNEKI